MKKLLLMSVIGSLALAQAGLAEDIQPPWWRGEWSTTSQIWEFATAENPAPPDGPAPNGQPPLPSTKVYVTPGPPPWDHWMEQDEGRYGVWPLSGWIDVIVDNHDPKPENEKWIWVQLTWRPQDPGEYPEFSNLDPPSVAPPELILEEPLGGGWRESTYSWKLDWNPPDETFTISGTINVDELVIDTWCVPEPATLGMLACGAFAVLLRRKK